MHSLLTGWLNSSYPKNINYLKVIAKSKVKPIALKSEREYKYSILMQKLVEQ